MVAGCAAAVAGVLVRAGESAGDAERLLVRDVVRVLALPSRAAGGDRRTKWRGVPAL